MVVFKTQSIAKEKEIEQLKMKREITKLEIKKQIIKTNKSPFRINEEPNKSSSPAKSSMKMKFRFKDPLRIYWPRCQDFLIKDKLQQLERNPEENF